jgi:hypothetical protein
LSPVETTAEAAMPPAIRSVLALKPGCPLSLPPAHTAAMAGAR